MRIIGLVAGRFQPFHFGHYQIYRQLSDIYGEENVFLITSDKFDVTTDPLTFDEKQKIISKCFMIPETKLYQTQSPYKPFDVLHKLCQLTYTAFVFGVAGEQNIESVSKVYDKLPIQKDDIKTYRSNTDSPGKPYYQKIEVKDCDMDSQSFDVLSKAMGKNELDLRFARFFNNCDNQEVYDLLVKRFGGKRNGKKIELPNTVEKITTGKRDFDDPRYKAWRNAVFTRDGWTCQLTGQKGGEVEAHHIVRWVDNEELRFDISNGITLSKTAHEQIKGREHLFESQFQKTVANKMKELRAKDGRRGNRSLHSSSVFASKPSFYFPKDPRSKF